MALALGSKSVSVKINGGFSPRGIVEHRFNPSLTLSRIQTPAAAFLAHPSTKADWEPTQSAFCASVSSVAGGYFAAALVAFFTGFAGAVRGTAFTALSSTAVSLATGLTAPAGISVVVTVLASSVPV